MLGSNIKDSRAFLGGLALMIIGAILSFKLAFYLLPEVFGSDALVARWWWEIVLNLQILSYAFMWFCHHNRMVHADGWWRLRAVSHFVIGMISVSYPVGVLLVSAYMDWFRQPPSPSQIYIVIVVAVVLWAIGTFIMPIVNWLMVRREEGVPASKPLGRSIPAWLNAFWPTFVAFLLFFLEIARDSVILMPFIPVLCYYQGAKPYFEKSRRSSERDSEF